MDRVEAGVRRSRRRSPCLHQFWQDKSDALGGDADHAAARACIGYAIALVIGVVVGLDRLAVEGPARRRRLDDHRPADDAVDRVVPRSRSCSSGSSESAILFVVVLGAAPSIANGLINGVDNIPPILLRAGRVLGARGLSSVRHVVLPGRAAVVRRRPEAGLGVRLAQPARR